MTNLLRAGVVLFFLSLAVWAITLNHHDRVIAHSEPWLWLTTALVSVGPELAGIVIGVVTIDYLNERRQDEQLKGQLILQLGSKHNDVTDTALRVLTARGWLYDGSLSDAFLVTANLSGAELEGADLSGANLWAANLSEANLLRVRLSGAILRNANLSRARFWTIKQLEQVETLKGATMPDEIQLGLNPQFPIDGPTFEQWKAQYLAKQGGTTTELRDVR
jgi:hypothetical protein